MPAVSKTLHFYIDDIVIDNQSILLDNNDYITFTFYGDNNYTNEVDAEYGEIMPTFWLMTPVGRGCRYE